MKRSSEQADPGSEATSHGTWSAKHWRSNDWSSSWSWGSWGWHWRSWDWGWQQWYDDDPEVEEEGQDNEASQTEGVQKSLKKHKRQMNTKRQKSLNLLMTSLTRFGLNMV